MFSTKLLDVKREVIELPNGVTENPTVSVCVPTYQHAEYIKSCLDSILMQECTFPFEVIVGEDESTDGTREICIKYAEKYPEKIRLLLHSRENNISINGHPSGRFNFLYGLSQARGKYIALCEGDDCWTDRHKLQKQVDFLEANEDFAICHHNLQVEYEDDIQERHLSELANSPDQKEVTGIEDLARGNYIFTASCMFRNNLFKRFPEWLLNAPVGDYVLHMLNAQYGMIKYLPDVMGVYRVHKGGLWENKTTTFRDEQWVKMLDQMSNTFQPRIKQILINSQKDFFGMLINQFREYGAKREYYSGKLLENTSYLFRSLVRRRRGSEVPTVSIVIPVSKDLDLTTECLNSIYSNTPRELFELILVESDPSVGIDNMVFEFEREFENVTVHRTVEKLTFAEACNLGIKLSDAEFILLLKHNMEVTPGWLEAMLDEAGKNDNVGIVGSRVMYKGTGVIKHAGMKTCEPNGVLTPLPVHRFRIFDHVQDAGASRDMQAVSGECILVNRDLVKTLGGLDENFPETYQGIDLCLRAGHAGFRVRYCANSVVCHIGPDIEDNEESSNGGLDRLNHKWAGKVKADLTEPEAQAEMEEIRLRHSLLMKSESAEREELIRISNRKESEDFKAFLASRRAIRSEMERTSQYRGALSRGDGRSSENAGRVSQFELVSNIQGVIARAEELIEAKEYEEAEKTLKGICLAAPSSVDALNDLAVVEFLQGRPEEALKTLKRVVLLDPQNQVANENIRSVLKKMGRVVEDVKSANSEGATFNDGKSLERAESLIQERQYKEAEILLRKILAESPSNLEALNDLAIVHSAKGEPDEAIALLSRLVSRDPSNIIALKNLGRLCIGLNRLEDGLQHCLKALEAAPADAEAGLMTAEICRVLGRSREAYSFYKRVLELDPGNEVAAAGVQTVDEQTPKGDPATELYNRAQAMIAERDYDHALTTLLEIVAISPNHADAHNDLAVLYHQTGDLGRAASHLERSVELKPEDSVSAKNLAILYSSTGRFEKALEVFQKLLTKNPRDIQILLAVANVCVKLNRPDDARPVLDRALSLTDSEQLRNQILSEISGIDHQVGARLAAPLHKDTNPGADAAEAAAAALPTSGKLVSIIIPVFNKLELTKKCIDALRANTSYRELEIIIVDNNSTDGTREYLQRLAAGSGDVTVIHNEINEGFAKANNRAAKIARGEYLLLLNNDTEPQQGWLSPLVEILDSDPSVGVAGSKLLFPDGTIQHAGVVIFDLSDRGREKLVAWHLFYKCDSHIPEASQPRCYQVLTAACQLVRRELFMELGGFDERFWNGYEDIDLCLKIQEKGYKLVYQPASVVIHHESQSGPERFSKVAENVSLLNSKWANKVVHDGSIDRNGKMRFPKDPRIRDYTPPKHPAKIDRDPTKASIVILTYNQLKFTKITIDSIRRHTRTPYEIIVVDNASTDGTVEYLKTQQDIRTVFNEENVGFPAGCNQGMEIAKGDYIVLLNNDVIVTDDWLEGLIECSGADPKVGIVGPRTNWISGYQLEREITYKKVSQVPAFAAKYRRKNRRKWTEVPRVAGFCMLIKRDVIEKIGGLDTLFGIGNCEDDDFCLRSKLSGFKVALAGDVFIHHFGSKSFNQKGLEKYLDTVHGNEKVFEDKWGVDPAGWWRDGKAPTKTPEIYVPYTAEEPVAVSQ